MMMKRDFSQPVLDLRGAPIRSGASAEALMAGIGKAMGQVSPEAAAILQQCLQESTGAELTVGAACGDALIAPLSGDEAMPLGERSRRLALALRVIGGEAEISPDERDMIKDCVTRYFTGALIPARIAEFLEAGS